MRVKKVEIEGFTGTRTIEYVHDLAGRVTRLIYPDESQARYAYDGAGRLSRVWDEQGNLLAAYTHTAAGNIDTHVVGEDIVNGSYCYNDREWVTGIDYPGKFTLTQQYDAVGNVSSQSYRRAASESEKAASYTYDNLHRLTRFNLDSGSSTQSYEYDRNGNLDQVTTDGAAIHHSYSRSTTPNRLDAIFGTGGSSQSYAYNENGWMTAMGADTITYDYRGLTTGVGTAAYTMDPDRRRVKKTVGTVTTYYLRGADGTVLAEYTGQTLSAKYVYAGSRRIARVASSSTRYYLTDHLGSTRSLVDEAGTVTAAYDYWPYGKTLATSGTDATHFRFTGHERDDESSLDYMLARSYAYDTGRFLRPDPMQDQYPGLSPYAYANNNPLKYVDPDGRVIKLSSKLTQEQRKQFEGYLANLRKTEIGNDLYNHVHKATQEFVFEISPEGKPYRGLAEIHFGIFPPYARTLNEILEVIIFETGSVVKINESLINGLGEMVESTMVEELFHIAEALGKLESIESTKEFYIQTMREKAMYDYYDQPHEDRAKEVQKKFRKQWEELKKQQQQ